MKLQGDSSGRYFSGNRPMRREIKCTDCFQLTENTQGLYYEGYLAMVLRETTTFHFKNQID
jgi:hypothetical protein